MEPAADGSTKRSITACDRCKEKKRKCIVTNEGQGCDRCVRLGTPCVYSELSTTSYIRSLQQKIEDLESKLIRNVPSPATIPPERPPIINAASSSSSTTRGPPPMASPLTHPQYQTLPTNSFDARSHISSPHSIHSPVESLHPTSHSGTGYSGVTRLGNPEAHRVWKHRTLNADVLHLPATRTAYPLDLDTTLKEMQVGNERQGRAKQEESSLRTEMSSSKKRKLTTGYRPDTVDTEYDNLVDSLSDRDLPRRMVQRVLDKWLRGDDVHHLYRQFFDNMNAYIALLDPELHTPQYCFSTSPVLHITILAVTTMVYRSEIYPDFFECANILLAQAFMSGDVSIGLCQSLSLLSVWKEATDHRSWLRVGYAIRAAYELGLHEPPVRPLPDDIVAAREQLNKERTFRQLALFDRTMFMLHGRTQSMIGVEVIWQLPEWLVDHPQVYTYADGMLAASYPQSEAIAHLLHGTGTTELDNTTSSFLASNVQNESNAWARCWLENNPPAPLHPVSRTFLMFYSLTTQFDITEWMTRVTAFKGRLELFANMLSRALEILRFVVSDLAPAGILLYAPDVLSFKIAKSAYLLAKKLSGMTDHMADEVVRVLTELSAVYQDAAKKSRPIMYSARFFADLAQVAAARGKLDGVSDRGGTDGGTDGGQQEPLEDVAGFGQLNWADLLQDFEEWLPEHFLPNIEDFGWSGYPPAAPAQ